MTDLRIATPTWIIAAALIGWLTAGIFIGHYWGSGQRDDQKQIDRANAQAAMNQEYTGAMLGWVIKTIHVGETREQADGPEGVEGE